MSARDDGAPAVRSREPGMAQVGEEGHRSGPEGGARGRTVLFVSIAAGLGGSTRSLATVMARLGPGVARVLAVPKEGKFPTLVREKGLAEGTIAIARPNDRRMRRLSRPATAFRIMRWARRHRREILAIHVNGLQEVSLAVPAALISRAPLVMWIHDFEVYPWTRRLGPIWRRLLRGHPVRWTAVSGTARRMIVESGLATAGEVVIVTNPIDPADVRAEWREASDPPAVGFIASADRRKGFHLLPEVDRELAEVRLRWRLFTGLPRGDLDPTWERLRALPESRISFSEKLRDVRDAYARCDVVFCPSLSESFCRVAAEAMLNGIPVVASDIEPLRELLGDDEAGLLFPPGDAVAAAAALRRVVENDVLRTQLGAAGRERARAFEPGRVVDRLSSLYGLTDHGSQG